MKNPCKDIQSRGPLPRLADGSDGRSMYERLNMIINFVGTYKPVKREEDSGYDLINVERGFVIPPNRVMKIPTGIRVEIPVGYGGFLMTKSSQAAKGLVVLGGVIDSGYRGEIIVCLLNASDEMQPIDFKQKVCQLVILPVVHASFVTCENLKDSERGEGGFGSTGL